MQIFEISPPPPPAAPETSNNNNTIIHVIPDYANQKNILSLVLLFYYYSMSQDKPKTIRGMLAVLGEFNFDQCVNIEEQFILIKKAYFKKILVLHPDKGGDPAEFR